MATKTLFLLLLITIHFGFITYPASAQRYEGEMAPWEAADKLFPKYAKFTVIDMETGLKFRVQRRAGSRHADVQPLTSRDTAIMKKIYNNEWSWKRRSIYVQNGKRTVAASMNGMPHGAGALKNNFPGHFCIHFYKSSTHSKREMDLSHKLMVYKAAKKTDELFAKADPYEIVAYFIAGIKEHDKRIVQQLSLDKAKWDAAFDKIEAVKIARLPILPTEDMGEDLLISIPIDIEWHIKDAGKQLAKTEMILFRDAPFGYWRVDSIDFLNKNHLLP
ncbi:hypothetical protein [Bacillus sp. B-jedd]|uniref:hypothetical protein n=1 Tax=Bacillus sp. B-jedd TaxID=1476857 RepID=UPI0005156E31|nr:hypothetical protein [Bacillus sp. B-jedd]CEG27524.1 hypothetical protein BN1002_02391 [Bacillus sp. B-jedd]